MSQHKQTALPGPRGQAGQIIMTQRACKGKRDKQEAGGEKKRPKPKAWRLR